MTTPTDVLNYLTCNRLWACHSGEPPSGHRDMRWRLAKGHWLPLRSRPRNGRTASLTSDRCWDMSGDICLLRGEVLFEIGVRDGQITLTPAQSWTVAGWRGPRLVGCMSATFQGPSGSVVTRTLPRSQSVAPPCTHSHTMRPGVGVGPLSSAGLTQELVAQIETALAQEASTPRGYNFAVPDVKQAGKLTTELRSSKGALNLVPSVASDAAWGAGQESKPADDWVSKRFGMTPPQAMVELRGNVELSVMAAAGVPVTIMSTSDGTAKKEDFRRFLHLTLQPMGRIIAQQIGDALDVDGLTFDFSGIGAADIAAKARAWGTLTKGGVSPQDAGAITGLPIDDVEPRHRQRQR